MSYIINNSRGNIVAVVAPGTVNTTSTPIALVGQGVTDYGTAENQNYVWILENFCKPTAPTAPLLGQLWYNNSTDTLSVYDSLNSWTAIASQTYVQAQKISPAFTGIPTAPTATAGTNTTQLATTQFVGTAINNYSVVASTTYAPINSPSLTGIPTGPTAAQLTSTAQLATTAFVQNEKASPTFTGIPTAPTAGDTNNSTQIATTAFVQNQKNSPILTGTPQAPTAVSTDNSTQIATTAFVQTQKINTALTGIPTAPTAASSDNSTQIATTAFVQNQKISPSLSGIPTAPTPPLGTNNDTLATTSFVIGTIINGGILGTMSFQNANAVAITGGSITGISPLAVVSGGTGATNAGDARTNLGIPTFPLSLSNGGTGASNAANARTNLGLSTGATTTVGTMATQDANAVVITGGAISNITDLAIADGGTGASTAANARTNLGLGTMATQDANAVVITGGTIINVNGMIPIGGIIMWSGSVASIPTGFALCNGSNSTPDLRDRFIVGAGGAYAVAAFGGSANATVVAHTHTVNDPGHAHGYLIPQQIFNGEFRNDVMAGFNRVSAVTSAATTGITINSAGDSGVNANLPPYYALCFIMRVL